MGRTPSWTQCSHGRSPCVSPPPTLHYPDAHTHDKEPEDKTTVALCNGTTVSPAATTLSCDLTSGHSNTLHNWATDVLSFLRHGRGINAVIKRFLLFLRRAA